MGKSVIHCQGDHILVEPIIEKMSKGGIAYIEKDPDSQVIPMIVKQGRVVSTGLGTYLDNGELVPPDSKVGRRVYYYSYATRGARGQEIEGVEYDCIKDQDVICWIEE